MYCYSKLYYTEWVNRDYISKYSLSLTKVFHKSRRGSNSKVQKYKILKNMPRGKAKKICLVLNNTRSSLSRSMMRKA